VIYERLESYCDIEHTLWSRLLFAGLRFDVGLWLAPGLNTNQFLAIILGMSKAKATRQKRRPRERRRREER
jgi:hypothetical protein